MEHATAVHGETGVCACRARTLEQQAELPEEALRVGVLERQRPAALARHAQLRDQLLVVPVSHAPQLMSPTMIPVTCTHHFLACKAGQQAA